MQNGWRLVSTVSAEAFWEGVRAGLIQLAAILLTVIAVGACVLILSARRMMDPINQLLSATGHPVIPIEDATVETLVSTCFTVVMAVIAWWKNNSFTSEAIKADEYLDLLRNNEWLGESTDEALYYEDDEEPEDEDIE